MRWPAAAVLQAAETHLPTVVVGESQLAALRKLALRVPFLVESYYLECRLDHSPQVDFLVLTSDRLGAAERLSAEVASEPSGTWRKTWSSTHGLLREWALATTQLGTTELVRFEYDGDDRLDPRHPVGSTSVCLEKGYMGRHTGAVVVDHHGAYATLRRATAWLVGEERREFVERCALKCQADLPPGGSLVYFSEMSTRQPCVSKLYVALPRPDVLPYLQRIDWPGDLADVRDVLGAYYGENLQTVFLDLSIARELTPRLGFALSEFHRREMQQFDPAWRWLPAPTHGAEKWAALAAWPGDEPARINGTNCRLDRWLDIKVVLDEARRVQSKAYLGFRPAFRRLFT